MTDKISTPIEVPQGAELYSNGGYGVRGTWSTTIHEKQLFNYQGETYLAYEGKGYKIGDYYSFPDSDFHELCLATRTGFKGIPTENNKHRF